MKPYHDGKSKYKPSQYNEMKRHEVLLLAPAEDHENVDNVFNEKMDDNLFFDDIADVVCNSMAQDDSSKQDKVQDLLEKRVDKEPWNNLAESH